MSYKKSNGKKYYIKYDGSRGAGAVFVQVMERRTLSKDKVIFKGLEELYEERAFKLCDKLNAHVEPDPDTRPLCWF